MKGSGEVRSIDEATSARVSGGIGVGCFGVEHMKLGSYVEVMR